MSGNKIESRERLIKALADEFDDCVGESYPVIDLTAQTVTEVLDTTDLEPEFNAHLHKHEIVAVERPDSHEDYRIMERFALSRPDEQAGRLREALSMRHPFKMFRGTVERMGLDEEWYAWRDAAYLEIAEGSLEFYGIEFKDGKIVCNNDKHVHTYLCEGIDEE